MTYRAMYMLGSCANGAERDKGTLYHAVEGWRALCGREPGRRSAGWSDYPENVRPISDVNCPRCRKRLDNMIAQARSDLRNAIDRQGRTETAEAWLADESAIEQARLRLRELGVDDLAEYEQARQP